MPRRLPCSVICLLFTVASAYCADQSQTQWQARIERLKQDPSVVRLYTFQEGKGAIVDNFASDRSGALCMVGYSPYGTFRGFPKAAAQPAKEYPRWNTGRWPWKKAVTCGKASPQFVRSQYYGLNTKVFSVETWIRPHALEEYEWVDGSLLRIPHGVWGSGWRIHALRATWCPQGQAGFRIGVDHGTFEVRSPTGNPLKFGKWNHLVAVYDAKKIRLYLNGKMISKPISQPIKMTPPRMKEENDIEGLEIGGKLRFDIDELVIYHRVLSGKEVEANFNRFKPNAAPIADLNPTEVEFVFPRNTGGYFQPNKPITCSIVIPAKAQQHAATLKVIRRNDNKLIRQQRLDLGDQNPKATFSLTPKKFGLYDFSLSLSTPAGLLVKQETFPIAVVPSVAAPSGLIVPQDIEAQPWTKSVGAEWARVILDWEKLEPQKRFYDWELADRKIDTAIASNLKVLCCVTGIPKWMKRDPQNDCLPADLAKYQTFIRTLANRYRLNVSAWEIWDEPFSAPKFFFRRKKEQYEKLRETAKQELMTCKSSKLVIDSATWYASCGVRQPAGKMGSYDPGNMNSLFYRDRLLTENGQTGVKTWPFRLFPEDTSVAFLLKQILLKRTNVKRVLLKTPPDEFYPRWNNTDGTPSKQGAAIAALSSLIKRDSIIRSLGTKDNVAFFTITTNGKTISVLIGNGKSVQVKMSSPVKGLDCFGNPLKVSTDAAFQLRTAVYLFGEINPTDTSIDK